MRMPLRLSLILLVFAPAMRAQDAPRVEIFGGPSYARLDISDIKYVNAIGWHTSFFENVNSWFGAGVDVSGHFSSPKFDVGVPNAPLPVDAAVNTYLYGPRISFRRWQHFTPYLEGLVGAANIRFTPRGLNNVSSTTFATALGGGIDYAISDRFAIRVIEADYLLTRFRELGVDPVTDKLTLNGPRRTQNNVRASTGIIFRFGHRR